MTIYDLKKGSTINSIELPLSVALGNFDGLHLGHAELIRCAKRSGERSCVFSFAENPFGVPRIMQTEDKLSVLSDMGVDYAVICDFSMIRNMSWEDFAQTVLIDKLHTKTAVCGFNFKFGKDACGNPEKLAAFMRARGGDCITVKPYCVDGVPVSSSLVRRALAEGDCVRAEKLLGRPYFIRYKVSHGNGIGTNLGFPTINHIYNEKDVMLSRGVYICSCLGHAAVTNVGVRPTVTDSSEVVYETYIIDYYGDLYERKVKVEFYEKLREEIRFESVEELCAAIAENVETARKYFNKRDK